MVARLRILTATTIVVALAAAAASAGAGPRPGRARPAPPVDLAVATQAGVVAQEQAESPKGRDDENDAGSGPMDVFSQIEAGWNARNVDMILRHFGPGKVAIAIDGGSSPVAGTFSKSQSHYLFKDLFRYTNTRKFEFVQFRNGEDGSQSYAIAERHYLRRDDGRLIKDKVYVSLHLDREDKREKWVVDEIKSIR